ncbi:TetR family transcriptional regulator [Falsochrobactrum sp. TDYN1]|uniref:TetR family transcriptional regulator n=1 Tax=Falsochrobactrum tianjinense TaxID=2706015 RepID=A0A949UW33_9HYPH|nr:TetR family transcriptional regulator [Falsochrobactrum sp. TDYN1]MBV2144886.1 TetR family transcriptional regulator [Falsochrobactrum sp. TDYN1]
MRRTKAEAAETREAILCSAERIFFEKGLAHSTLDEIATAAGVTRGAIYWHFQNKADIFLELFDTVRLPRISVLDLDDADGNPKDPLAFIEKTACDWLDTLVVDEQRQRLLTILVRTNFADEFAEVQAAKDALEEEQARILVAIMEKAATQGILHPQWSAQSASNAFRWLMKGMVWEWLLSMRSFEIATDGKKTLQTFLSSIRKA